MPTPSGSSRAAKVSTRRLTRWLLGPIGVWTAFALVHLVLGVVDLLDTQRLPFGDVTLVYRFWMDYAAANGVLVGIDTSWVYPVGALLPMGLAYVLGSAAYGVVWLVMVAVLDAVALAALLRRSATAAWWWIAFLAALGPVALGRIDAVTAPLAILGLMWLGTRPAVAGALLALGAWIKVWPAALFAAAVILLRRRAPVVLGAAVVSAVILVVALLLGSGANVLGFVFEQGDRGLQVEAPVSGWWLWEVVLGLGPSRVYYDREILTYQVTGAGTGVTSALMTPLLALAVAGVVVLAARALRRGADAAAMLPTLATTLVLTLIVVNKVGSPQFIGWLAAPIVAGLVLGDRFSRRIAVPVLGVALLTQVVYPWFYTQLVSAEPVLAAVLTLRNLALVVLLGYGMRELWLAGTAEERLPALRADEEQGSVPSAIPSPTEEV